MDKIRANNLMIFMTILYLMYKCRFYLTVSAVLLKGCFPGLIPKALTRTDLEVIDEMRLETDGLIKYYGYPSEIHTVVTKDGYVLNLFRIPFGKTNNTRNGIPVFLQHGTAGSSSLWTSSGKQSLAFILADAGYDVWLGNFRGNRYTRRHLILSVDSPLFWEGGVETLFDDCTAMIHFVRYKTKYDQILTIGFSLGATAISSALASQPRLEEKVKGAVFLAISTHPRYFSSFLQILVDVYNYFPTACLAIFHKSFVLHTMSDYFIENFCTSSSYEICFWLIGLSAGIDFSNPMNKTRMPVHLRNGSSGMSVIPFYDARNLGRGGGEFTAYNLGRKKNVELYGRVSYELVKVSYDFSKITIPVAIFQWPNDALATPMDVEIFSRQLPNLIHRELSPRTAATHLEFFINDSTDVSFKILTLLRKMWDNY